MPTIVGILTFMSRINLCSVELSMKKDLYPRGQDFVQDFDADFPQKASLEILN